MIRFTPITAAKTSAKRALVLPALLATLGLMLSAPAAFALDGDLNGDGAVDGDDTAIAQAAVGTAAGEDGFVAGADHDGDGIISMRDLTAQMRLGQ